VSNRSPKSAERRGSGRPALEDMLGIKCNT
jgi:hypothetical protein